MYSWLKARFNKLLFLLINSKFDLLVIAKKLNQFEFEKGITETSQSMNIQIIEYNFGAISKFLPKLKYFCFPFSIWFMLARYR